ncbi:tRNA (5-methylaminomethyl-2-thiouridine)(34)-methyltransferase MnmD [Flavihumibacter fluvii]|uniref:tRNA (5-methylaminomethyl-2-thiouridine)(34)-methyltransferase MnmD n=1 Tax=Flavihumibacter fluvii TaxID=2838157 RepID=UPI001BDDD091|nr:tRNA (5-methylaminomethyl-2-thiouridine)(34)-methyltransferase MnmD [Flavihumibacter fluvii]ULQ51388.1 tRNA (5-methylaminomethyl-2-thiouridine)(34)-methyltransferase MnmD [Flavihumibacter fluvii]
MERILQSTADGSVTIAIPSLEVTYHSKHGAIQESLHIYIEAGLKPILKSEPKQIDILEMGFGTGLNAILTLMEAGNIPIRYECLEPFPVHPNMAGQLNYCEILKREDLSEKLLQMHQSDWETEISIQPNFTLIKHLKKLTDYNPVHRFDLIYFDAFGPNTQPELWTTEIFSTLFNCLKENGILVTYCSKSEVRRAILAAGFTVEKIPGPWGKREILRAKKNGLQPLWKEK